MCGGEGGGEAGGALYVLFFCLEGGVGAGFVLTDYPNSNTT